MGEGGREEGEGGRRGRMETGEGGDEGGWWEREGGGGESGRAQV